MELDYNLRFEPLNNNEVYYDELLILLKTRISEKSDFNIEKSTIEINKLMKPRYRKVMKNFISDLFEKEKISRLLRDKTKATLENWNKKEFAEKILLLYIYQAMNKLK